MITHDLLHSQDLGRRVNLVAETSSIKVIWWIRYAILISAFVKSSLVLGDQGCGTLSVLPSARLCKDGAL